MDRISLFPGRHKIIREDTGEEYYIIIEEADGPLVLGTPYNRDSVLRNETALALGLDLASNPTPNDAFMALAVRTAVNTSPPTIPLPPDLDPILNNNSWSMIANISENWIAADNMNTWDIASHIGWHIGDAKSLTIGGVNHELRIIGFNHDGLAGGGYAGITLELIPCWGATAAARIGMEATSTNANGWHGSRMRMETLPNYRNQLPADLQAVMKMVLKPTSIGSQSSTINIVQDNIFLLSEVEVMGHHNQSAAGEGRRYLFYTTYSIAAAAIKQQPAGTVATWWLRSPSAVNNLSFIAVGLNGVSGWEASTQASAVSFGICI